VSGTDLVTRRETSRDNRIYRDKKDEIEKEKQKPKSQIICRNNAIEKSSNQNDFSGKIKDKTFKNYFPPLLY
jgi:hypothetical protein